MISASWRSGMGARRFAFASSMMIQRRVYMELRSESLRAKYRHATSLATRATAARRGDVEFAGQIGSLAYAYTVGLALQG